MGLGASLITLPLWGVTRARRILGLPRSVTPCCVVALGRPRGRYGPTTRLPVEQVTHLDSYGKPCLAEHLIAHCGKAVSNRLDFLVIARRSNC